MYRRNENTNRKDDSEQKRRGHRKEVKKAEEATTDKETDEGSEQDSKKIKIATCLSRKMPMKKSTPRKNEEDWIEYIRRSTKEAEEHMENHKIKCWTEVHRRQKWRMARRMITLPAKRWNRRVFNWHPGLDSSIRARRQVGRPQRRWEDDLNEFMKTEEGKEKDKYNLKKNNSWMDEIEDSKNGRKMKKSSQRFSKGFWAEN